MTTIHLPGVRAARTGLATWILSSVISASALIVASQAMAEEPVAAVYKAHELSFQYRSSYNSYACHELQQRVSIILRAVGARDDISVDVRDCDVYLGADDRSMDPVFGGRDETDPFGRNRNGRPDPFGRTESDRGQAARIRVKLMFPTEVTPQILAEIDKDKSRRELVSRVTRNPAAAFNDPIVFAAQRQEVTLSRKLLRLKPEDCSLLEQMNTQVFRRLKVRVISQRADCNPRSSTSIPPQLTVETLMPTGALMPMPDPESKKAPAASEPAEPQEGQPPTEPAPQ